jgi:hypothetical protein
MINTPPLKGKPFLLKLYYRKIELLSIIFTTLLVIVCYVLAKEVVETRRQAHVIAVQGVQQGKLLEDQIKFNRFLIDRETARAGANGRQGLIDQANLDRAQANRDRAELRRLEDALRAAGVHLPSQSFLEGPGASPVLPAAPLTTPSATVAPRAPSGPVQAAHHFPNLCIAGICLFGDI